MQQPKSIKKDKSTPSPAALASPETLKSPSPEPALQPDEEEFDKIEVDRMKMIAAAAAKLEKDARKKRMEEDFADVQKQLELTKFNLDIARDSEKRILYSQDKAERALVDARKEIEEARLANGRLENKLRILQGLFKRKDEQIEKLQQELVVTKEAKAEMERLLERKTAKETAKVDK